MYQLSVNVGIGGWCVQAIVKNGVWSDALCMAGIGKKGGRCVWI